MVSLPYAQTELQRFRLGYPAFNSMTQTWYIYAKVGSVYCWAKVLHWKPDQWTRQAEAELMRKH